MKRVMIAFVRGYQWLISPLMGPGCRYMPSCSAYAITAIERFGAFYGGWLAIRRISACHPWGRRPHHDPVPPRKGEGDKAGP